jgi:hypothetical protein
VTDLAGNQDFCTTYIVLQDNGGQPGGVCVDTTTAAAAITGRLLTEEKEGVEFATIELKGSSSNTNIPASKSKADGTYAFSNIPMNENQSLKALRDDSPMNGISTLDLVLIQKHILGTEPLKSPYKVIAADVDNSNDVSVIDLIELRKLILGLYDKLPNSTSWKFIPGSYQFADPLNPWGYPTEDVLHDMTNHMVRDFVGVKIGDVNSSAVAHSLMGTEIRNAETGLIFEVHDKTFRKGEMVRVEFKSSNFRGISGFQGTLKLEGNMLKLAGVGEQSKINLKDQNIGRRWENEGLITMSWNTNTSIDLTEKDVLFSMVFTALTDGRLSEAMRLGSQRTIAESYEGKGELGNLSIKFVGKNGLEVTSKSELYQNYPNPFDNRTIIGINLSESMKGALKITDVTGRTIKVIEKEWMKGYHEVWLDRRDIKASGVFILQF